MTPRTTDGANQEDLQHFLGILLSLEIFSRFHKLMSLGLESGNHLVAVFI